MKLLQGFQKQVQQRKWTEGLVLWLSLVLLAASSLSLLNALPWFGDIARLWLFLVALLCAFLLYICGIFKAVALADICRHLNHHFPATEYSTQLLLRGATRGPVEALQLQKVQAVVAGISVAQFKQTLAPMQLKFSALLSLLAGIIFCAGLWFSSQNIAQVAGAAPAEPQALLLKSASVIVTAPEYMRIPAQETQELNIESWQGASIRWALSFNRRDDLLTLRLSEGETLQPKWQGNTAIFQTQTLQSQSYHLRQADKVYQQGFYSILVQPDRAPTVRFPEQQSSTIKFAKNQIPILDLAVLLKDDFGLTSAIAKMSLARGSGEAVKFRDLEKALPEVLSGNIEQLLNLHWDLRELGMEPGDELYLSIVALDNKQDGPQQGKSSTLIVKWLDEQLNQITAEGIVADIELEYFKSQRQIIIETKQLIQDKEQLDIAVFNETSRQLGLSQSDLKQRYGQYLGDEFEGVAMSSGDHFESESEHHDEEHEDEEHGERPQEGVGHEHEGAENANSTGDLSGRMALINQYGHAHGDADIGPVLKYNPKAYMKRSVEQMWSAELYLMLGEPEKALPFEEEALKYLKLARQADRIYVKRLGFEPPPVSEEKRLTGELEEILNPKQEIRFRLDDASQQQLRQAYQMIALGTGRIQPQQQQVLSELLQWIKTQVADRPALIQSQVQLETLLGNQHWLPDVCAECRLHLQQKIWQLLAQPDAAPFIHSLPYLSDELVVAENAAVHGGQQ